MGSRGFAVGHVLAPWPFLIFGLIAMVCGAVACPLIGVERGTMVAFDAAAVAFLVACAPLFRHRPNEMRQSAQRNDANRGVLLLIAALVTVVILVAVGSELAHKGRPQALDVVLVIGTLCLSWLFSTLVYTLHYAHLFYTRSSQGQDLGGLCFPGTAEPDYWDFAYFSSCLAMTFQTSGHHNRNVPPNRHLSYVGRICLQHRCHCILH